MNKNEYFLYKLLIQAVEGKYTVIPQVHLDELVKPDSNLKDWIYSLRHINQKSVDFVICKIGGMHPLLAIELDGDSHLKEETVKRDQEVERILMEAKVPLVRFKNNHNLTVEILADIVKK